MELRSEPLSIDTGACSVSALWSAPPRPRAVCVYGHGSSAPMTQPFNVTVASGLFAAGIATLRYNFPFMEDRARWRDSTDLAVATVAVAAAKAASLAPGAAVFAGGKSHGGRMTSNAAARGLLPAVRGIFFFGFPLHEGVPGTERALHLRAVKAPILFLQGTRDVQAELPLLRAVVAGLGGRATLSLLEDADHGFQLPGLPGQGNPAVMATAMATLVAWIARVGGASTPRVHSA